jgi:IMP dehydrogenase
MIIKEGLAYNDVLLVPRYSDIRSRTEVSIAARLGGFEFNTPVIASPMDTITEESMVAAMSKAKSLAIIHRYNTVEGQIEIVRKSLIAGANFEYMAAAIGTSQDEFIRARALVDAGIEILCVDVAHGHHILMKNALEHLTREFGTSVHIIAGNVATKGGYVDLVAWGADSVRVGVGSGSICSTRTQTGHGVPVLETIFSCSKTSYAPIIADGGIRTSGDIVKALAAGAEFVILGSILSGTSETPGDIITTKEGRFKSYRGMASKDAQMDWRGRQASLEGIATTVPYKGSVVDVMADLERGIRSGLSYSGARTIPELREKAIFMRQTSAGQFESSTHILNK